MIGRVKIQEIEINNFKNVEHGVVSFQSYNSIKKKEEYKNTDVLGIYGQNGSGKTALVEAMDILKSLLTGSELKPSIKNLFMFGTDVTSFKYIFSLNVNDKKYLVKYNFSLICNESDKVEVSEEELKFAEVNKDNRCNYKTIISYKSNDDKNVFSPKSLYLELTKNESVRTDILVAKELSKENSTSFIFSKRVKNKFNIENNRLSIYSYVIQSLYEFGVTDLFVVKNENLGFINLNHLMPFTFRVQNGKEFAGGSFIVKLFEPSTLSKELYEILNDVTRQINIVLESMVPGLNLGIKKLKEELTEDGSVGIAVELLSIRGGTAIPLKYESDGIKKIISILSALIAMYNNEKVCVVVDELDAGVFEFLLGELLSVLKENSKGQLIFTSHNLRALEVLDKNDIIFTTTNPKNRYIRFKNVKSTNNLRDFYLRCIFLGGQDEEIYKSTKKYLINRAFRKAGTNNE